MKSCLLKYITYDEVKCSRLMLKLIEINFTFAEICGTNKLLDVLIFLTQKYQTVKPNVQFMEKFFKINSSQVFQ
jgi:hypothetical protein